MSHKLTSSAILDMLNIERADTIHRLRRLIADIDLLRYAHPADLQIALRGAEQEAQAVLDEMIDEERIGIRDERDAVQADIDNRGG